MHKQKPAEERAYFVEFCNQSPIAEKGIRIIVATYTNKIYEQAKPQTQIYAWSASNFTFHAEKVMMKHMSVNVQFASGEAKNPNATRGYLSSAKQAWLD